MCMGLAMHKFKRLMTTFENHNPPYLVSMIWGQVPGGGGRKTLNRRGLALI